MAPTGHNCAVSRIKFEPEQCSGSRCGGDEAIDVVPQTPNSSEPENSLINSVALLSRPIEGFHYPRQHLFTDGLVGRFYEDSSLDAEIRKANKSLAGRLGNARCDTRPSLIKDIMILPHSSNHPLPRDSHSTKKQAQECFVIPPEDSKSGRAHAAGSMLSSRKEHIEKEIMEQKALIQELEEKMALLGSHGRMKSTTETSARGSMRVQETSHSLEGVGVDEKMSTSQQPCSKKEGVEGQPCESIREIEYNQDAKVNGRSDPEIEGLLELTDGRCCTDQDNQGRGNALSGSADGNYSISVEDAHARQNTSEVAIQTDWSDTEQHRALLPLQSSTTWGLPEAHQLPAGSGRAAAFAAVSSKRGMLTSPEPLGDDPEHPSHRFDETLASELNATGCKEGMGNHKGTPGSNRVPLRTLGVEDTYLLLKTNGLQEQANDFLFQRVDGEMLSDPDLCEADFIELGLAEEGPHDDDEAACRRATTTFLLNLFRQCQKDGVVLPLSPEVDSSGAHTRSRPGEGPGQRDLGALEQASGRGKCNTLRISNCSTRGATDPTGVLGCKDKRIVAEISLDISEPAKCQNAVGAEHHGRRMSIKLNRGVVVTAAGQNQDLVVKVDEPGENDESTGRVETVVNNNLSGASISTASRGRRMSLSVPALTLDLEYNSSKNQGITHDPQEKLPPQVVVRTGVFNS